MYRCYYEKEKKENSVQSVQVYTVYRLLFMNMNLMGRVYIEGYI